MNAVVKIFIMLALLPSTVHSGPLSYVICISTCYSAWVACVTAGGGVVATATGGGAVPAAIAVCNAAHAACVAACAAVGATPIP